MGKIIVAPFMTHSVECMEKDATLLLPIDLVVNFSKKKIKNVMSYIHTYVPVIFY